VVRSTTTTVEFTARLQLTSVQPGIVYGIYFYRCDTDCEQSHDEIDIELVTNLLQRPCDGSCGRRVEPALPAVNLHNRSRPLRWTAASSD
jgi:hypothetical protein